MHLPHAMGAVSLRIVAKAYQAQRHREQRSIEEKLTSATWASMPRAHRQQTSQEEKLTSVVALEPSRPGRQLRRRVDIKLALSFRFGLVQKKKRLNKKVKI